MPNYGGESSGGSDRGGGNYGGGGGGNSGNSWNSRDSVASRNRNTGLTGNYWGDVATSQSGSGGRANSFETRAQQTARAEAERVNKAKAVEAARVKLIEDTQARTGLISTDWENGGISLSDALRGSLGQAAPNTRSAWAGSAPNTQPQNLAANSSLSMGRTPWDNVETTQTNNFPMGTTWGDLGHTIGNVAGNVAGGPGAGLVGGAGLGFLGSLLDTREEAPENTYDRRDFTSDVFGNSDRALAVQDEPSNWATDTFGDAAGMLGGAFGDALLGPLGSLVGNKLGSKAGEWYGGNIAENIANSIESGSYGPADFNAENNYGLGVGSGNDNRNVGFSEAGVPVSIAPQVPTQPTSFEGDPRYAQKSIPTWLRDLYKGGGDGSEMYGRINPWGRRG